MSPGFGVDPKPGTDILAPCVGVVRPITDCVDEVFSSQMVGPGIVIDPAEGPSTVVAPIAGKVVKIHPHAFVLLSDGIDAPPVGVLVHLGINTVRLDGRGFEVHVAQGDAVAAGDRIVSWDPSSLPAEAAGSPISPEVPVVLLDQPADSLDLTNLPASVAAGDALFRTG